MSRLARTIGPVPCGSSRQSVYPRFKTFKLGGRLYSAVRELRAICPTLRFGVPGSEGNLWAASSQDFVNLGENLRRAR
jgi:hypothetical protein